MANLPEKKEWKGVYQWETSDRALGGPDSQFTKPIRDLTDRTAYLKEQVEKGNKDLVEHSKSTDHPEASTTQKGFVQLSSAVNSTSEGVAATSKAVKIVYDLAASKANSTHTHSEYASVNHSHSFSQITGVPIASISASGVVKLSNAINNTSHTEAATANSVKITYDLAASKANSNHSHPEYASASHSHPFSQITGVPIASISASGVVKLSNAINNTSHTEAATANSVKITYDLAASKANSNHSHSEYASASHSHPFSQITGVPTASTAASGIVKLSNATNSTSQTEAATPSAVKKAYDLAESKADSAHSHLDYALKTQIPHVPVQSVNGKTGSVSINANDVGAIGGMRLSAEQNTSGTNANIAWQYRDEFQKIPANAMMTGGWYDNAVGGMRFKYRYIQIFFSGNWVTVTG